MFAPNVEYDMRRGALPAMRVAGYQVGVLGVRNCDGDNAALGNGESVTLIGYAIDHIPSGCMIWNARRFAGALLVADTLSLTAPEHAFTLDAGMRWVSPYLPWFDAVMRAEALDLPLPTYRAFIADRMAA
jgi:hypothetical protein